MIERIDRLAKTTDLSYPDFLASHPRNAHVDFAELDAYVTSPDEAALSDFSLYVKTDGRLDAVHVPGIPGPLVSTELRDVFLSVVPGDLDFLPVEVNGEPYWILRVMTEVDALDPDRTDFERSPAGEIWGVDWPTFVVSRLTDPQMFTVPETPRTYWATPGVGEAYWASGCNGLFFAPTGEVV